MPIPVVASLAPPSRPSPWAAYGLTLAAVAAATVAAILVDAGLGAPNASLVLVLPVVLAAASFGWGQATAAALVGTVAYNFFLIEPRYTFRVADPANLWALILLLITAGVVSVVAAQSRRRALAAQAAADQALALQSLARTLVGATSRQAIADCCAEAVSQLFRSPAVVLLEEGQAFLVRGLAGGAVLSRADEDAAHWALAARHAARGGAYPVDAAEFDFWPVVTRSRQTALIGVRFDPDARPDSPERFIEIVEGYLSVALDREAYAKRRLRQQVESAGERMKADLLAAVSHDLRTPLSTIVFTLQSLRKFDRDHDRETRVELLDGAEREAARLGRMVENLLDMSRVEADAVTVHLAAANPAELIAAARERAAAALANRRIEDATEGRARPLLVDRALFETALANLLENAGKYSPPGSVVRLESGEAHGMGWIEVIDEGPGFDRAPEALFEKFVRGREDDGRPPGSGLGLSIARSFIEAQSGRIEASNRDEGEGARVRLAAPLAPAGAV